MSSSLRLEDNEPIRIYPDDFAVWLTAVPTDEIANIIGDDLPVYSAGESIKAGDLNEANSILVQKIQELEQEIAVLKAQATV